jgi:hypothetical protein
VKTYEHRDSSGRLASFEIDNLWIARRGVARIVERIPGSRVVPGRDWKAERRDGEFCLFEVQGAAFVAEEPFNDNSRYLIAPRRPTSTDALEAVRQAFALYEPTSWLLVGRVMGVVLAALGLLLVLGGRAFPWRAGFGVVGVALLVVGGLLLLTLLALAGAGFALVSKPRR